MKKKLISLFLLNFSLLNAMDFDFPEKGKRLRDSEEVLSECFHDAKSRKLSDDTPEKLIMLRTSDGIKVTLSHDELCKLNSNLLNGLLEEFADLSQEIPLSIIDERIFSFIKCLLNEDDKEVALHSYEGDWSDILTALEYLDASELLHEVCEWVSLHTNFSLFDGKNIFSRFLKDGRFCASLNDALYKKLTSEIEFYNVEKMGRVPYKIKHLDDEMYVSQGQVGFIDAPGVQITRYIDFLNDFDSCYVARDHSFVVTKKAGEAKLWNLRDLSATLILPHHAVRFVFIAPDSSFIVTVSDHEKKLWRLNEDRTLNGEPISFGPGGSSADPLSILNSSIITARDNKLYIYRLGEDHKIFGPPFVISHESSINTISVSPTNLG
jgi:hypothetical protein